MAHSQRLRLREVRAVFRLLGEVRELGEDPAAWKQLVVEQLPRLIGAQLGISIENLVLPSGQMVPIHFIDRGWGDDGERRLFLDYMADPEHDGAPEVPPIARLMQRKSLFTSGRRQLVEDAVWYGSRHVNECRRAARVDDCFASSTQIVFVNQGIYVHLLAMHRAWRDRPFEPRQLRLVHLFHDELRRFWQRDPAASAPALDAGLAPRLRQTLAGLLAGSSEKEVAQKLGLSRNTVHRYVTDLYRHFHVSSRAELLAQCHRRACPAAFRPRLFLEAQLDASLLAAQHRPGRSANKDDL